MRRKSSTEWRKISDAEPNVTKSKNNKIVSCAVEDSEIYAQKKQPFNN